ncbi:MAG: hypothetical protein RIS02_1289, partial [Pseudomonadota bacterium]
EKAPGCETLGLGLPGDKAWPKVEFSLLF